MQARPSTPLMSWEKIKSAIKKLPHEGPEGFEGFVAKLLGELLNQPFIIARKGDQPGGDARSFDGTVRLQAKHYKSRKIPDVDIITDFHRVRLNYPSMETYVVGSAFPIAEQLRSALDDLEFEFGIEIATLDYSTQASPLSVLAISFWHVVRGFRALTAIETSAHAWVASQGQSNDVQVMLNTLRSAFTESPRLFARLRNASNRQLAERFGKAPVSQTERFAINLPRAIFRKSIRNEFEQWRDSDSVRVLVLEGDEGMGKTWAAASCADEIAREDGYAVIWMDSHEWVGVPDFHELIGRGLAKLSFPGVKDWTHWSRKVEFTWPTRI